MNMPKVHVIHLQSDQNRKEFLDQHYSKQGIAFEIVPAINGHNMDDLRPHYALIADHFWGKAEVKPGALGCFLSHYSAWRKLVNSGEEFWIIAEDDSAPDPEFMAKWPQYQMRLEGVDLLFLNDRLARWASADFDEVNHALAQDQELHHITNAKARAPGGDGYVLSVQMAAHLMELTQKMGMICGVDWFILGALLDENAPHWPLGDEFAFIQNAFAGTPKPHKGWIAKAPLFSLNRGLPSAIVHKHRVNIKALKSKLEKQ